MLGGIGTAGGVSEKRTIREVEGELTLWLEVQESIKNRVGALMTRLLPVTAIKAEDPKDAKAKIESTPRSTLMGGRLQEGRLLSLGILDDLNSLLERLEI